MVLILLRTAARSASLSRFQCAMTAATTPTKACGIAARYLASSSSSSSGSGGGSSSSSISSSKALAEGLRMKLLNAVSNKNDASTKDSSTATTPLASADKSKYVHPLSQIVLLYLQSDDCHEWVTRAGLDRNLTLHQDGTFSLESATTSARIWTAYCPDEKKHWLSYSSSSGGIPTGNSSSTAADANPATVLHKFMLQDNLLSAWHDNKNSSHARIEQAVRDLMQEVG